MIDMILFRLSLVDTPSINIVQPLFSLPFGPLREGIFLWYTQIMQTSSLTEYTKRTFFEMMKDVATSIPGHVLAFDPETQLAQIQIGIVTTRINGTTFEPSPIIEVPVYFMGGDFAVEYQIDVGNEGFILFSQRCVDGWKNTGGVANNPILRFHDMSDAVFFPGIRSQPNVISGFENDGIRLRNKTGAHYVWLKNDGTIELKNENGNVTMTPDGTIDANGAIITPLGAVSSPVSLSAPSIIVNGKELKDHTHSAGTYVDAESRPITGNSGTQP